MKECVWNFGNSLGCLLVISFSVVVVNVQGQQPRLENGMVTRGSEPSGIRVWLTPLDMLPRPVEMLVEGEGNLD